MPIVPFRVVPSKVPLKWTSCGLPSIGMLIVKLNLSAAQVAAENRACSAIDW